MPLVIRRQISRRKEFPDANELNLTPFMDLLISIVPFLMVSAVFASLAVVETTAPSRQSSTSPSNTSLVVLMINRDGFSITGSGPIMKNAKTNTLIPKKNGDYDLQTLTDVLNRLKTTDPSAQDILLLSQPEVVYSNLIEAMDAARENNAGEPLFPNAFFGGTV